jgi:hypothetical protein
MAVSPEWGRRHPCWVMVDEAHSLKRLPSLYAAETEGRKYGLKLVLGTQNKHQFEEHYGRSAPTMLSAPHLKIFLRCNEPESARWVSDVIGEDERERLRVGTTAAVEARGRDAINYSTFTERRAVVSKEEIMSLPNLHGYWKHEDKVVPFRYEARNYRQVAHGFRPREAVITSASLRVETAAPAEADVTLRHPKACPEEGVRLEQLSPAKDEPHEAEKAQDAAPRNAVEAAPGLQQTAERAADLLLDGEPETPGTKVELDFD